MSAKFLHLLLRQNWNERSRERVIESVKEAVFNIFTAKTSLQDDVNNSNFNQKLKSINFFISGLQNMSTMFQTVQFLLPNNDQINNESFKSNIEYLRNNFGNIIHFFIILAKSIPGHATYMRYQALIGFYVVYNKTFTI